jgi:hypothetical protein
MLDAIRHRRISTIVAWHPDRLHRQTRELVGFIDLINEYGVHVETVTAGRTDFTTPTGRMHARIAGTIAEYESEHKSERIRRKLEQNATEGLHHGGVRPYGWQEDRITPDPAEAAIVREVTAKVIAGESIGSIAKQLNAAGHRTAQGIPWRDVHVRQMVLRPRNAGLRQHHGVVAGQGRWEPLVAAEELHEVQAILRNPARRTHSGQGGRVHLLSTIARCGVCGGPMTVGKTSARTGKPRSVYRCRDHSHVARDQELVDDYVTQVVLARLSLPDAKNLLVEPDRVDEAEVAAWRAQELQNRLHEAAEAYAGGAITMAQLSTINASIIPKLEEAQERAASPSRSRLLGDLVFLDPAEVWGQLAPERRRAVVDLLMEVRILPARRPYAVFRPESIEITWR